MQQPAAADNVRGNDAQFAAGNVTDGNPASYWASDDEVRTATLTVDFAQPARIGCVRLEEYIALGQRIESFAIDARVWGQWLEMAVGTTIGAHRLLRFPAVHADALRLRILSSQACPTIRRIAAFREADE